MAYYVLYMFGYPVGRNFPDTGKKSETTGEWDRVQLDILPTNREYDFYVRGDGVTIKRVTTTYSGVDRKDTNV